MRARVQMYDESWFYFSVIVCVCKYFNRDFIAHYFHTVYKKFIKKETKKKFPRKIYQNNTIRLCIHFAPNDKRNAVLYGGLPSCQMTTPISPASDGDINGDDLLR